MRSRSRRETPTGIATSAGDYSLEAYILSTNHYQIELQLQGGSLDQHGYLVDIVEIEAMLNALVARYRDQTLNELSEFAGLNPSIEHFSRILCQTLSAHIQADNIRAVTVRLWENEIAWASYRQER